MIGTSKDILGDYDFSRSDKLFILKVPTFKIEDGVAYYEFNLRDLINNETYVSQFRYNELKNIHELLTKLNVQSNRFSSNCHPSQLHISGSKRTTTQNSSKNAGRGWKPISVA